MRINRGQQQKRGGHQKREMNSRHSIFFITLLVFSAIFASGCISIKKKEMTAILPKLETAETTALMSQINRLASVDSMRAKMDLRFEDNSFAELGITEKYRAAPGEIVVQRPSNILLKIQAPVIYSDIVQMTSDGEKFRVAVLEDGAGGKYRNFVVGSNSADYSVLQKEVDNLELGGNGDAKEIKKNVNAFANIRPQHFTEAILMRPTNDRDFYVQSEIFQDEVDPKAKKNSPLARIMRGYYLLDELKKNDDGTLRLSRRFWFDRVGLISLARQQIFDEQGNLVTDIVYGAEAEFTESKNYSLPMRIEVTRPKEKYKMSLTYLDPATVSIGKTYKSEVFVLENTKNLPMIDLDKKLSESGAAKPSDENGKAALKDQ